jgi:hypothetical protein
MMKSMTGQIPIVTNKRLALLTLPAEATMAKADPRILKYEGVRNADDASVDLHTQESLTLAET